MAPLTLSINIAGVAVVLVLLWLITRRTGEWLTFAHIFSIFWGANLFVSEVWRDGLIRPDNTTLAILFSAWWAFLFGTYCVICKPVEIRPTNRFMRVSGSKGVFVLLTLILLQLISFVYELWYLHFDFISFYRDFFYNSAAIRITGLYADIEFPMSFSVWRWDHVLYIPLAAILHFQGTISRRHYVLIGLFALVACSARYTRAPVIMLSTCCFISWIILHRPNSKTLLCVGGFLSTLGIIGFVASQTFLVHIERFAQVSLSESFIPYIGASPKAYEMLLKGNFPRESGFYSLECINYLLNKTGILANYPGWERPEVFTPVITNVYTFLDAFTLDWGIFGAIAGACLIGAAIAWIYNRLVRQPNYFNLVAYSYLVYSCIMSIANNEFIRASLPINFMLAILLTHLVGYRSKIVLRPIRRKEFRFI